MILNQGLGKAFQSGFVTGLQPVGESAIEKRLGGKVFPGVGAADIVTRGQI
ncbi:MAG TPA: hypothetical protein VGL72_22265 [Bryobacteraceae bacterium]